MKIINTALISISDKSNLDLLANIINKFNINVIATGSSYNALTSYGIANIQKIDDYTGFPEVLGGRVKTLHPKVFIPILAQRSKKSDRDVIRQYSTADINLVIINLYPFEKVSANSNDIAKIIENIDIGGPSLIRAAAKNYQDTLVITNTNDYKLLEKEMLENQGKISLAFREDMAKKAFAMILQYDAIISNWMNNNIGNNSRSDIDNKADNDNEAGSNSLTDDLTLTLSKNRILRYGENPHQVAALYCMAQNKDLLSIASMTQFQGKDLSYNNILDGDAALRIILEMGRDGSKIVAIVKHNNPCGIAIGKNVIEAYKKALSSDSKSAFGGVVAINDVIDLELANLLYQHFFEVIIATDIDEDAFQVLEKKKNLRLLTYNKDLAASGGLEIKSIINGLLIQNTNKALVKYTDIDIVTDHSIDNNIKEELSFAFNLTKFVKSNAIILVNNYQTVAIGAGQMSRIDSVEIAENKYKEFLKNLSNDSNYNKNQGNLILASDAFLPFKDNVELAHRIGVKFIVQTGGSVRDKEVISTAQELGIVMAFTGVRNFSH